MPESEEPAHTDDGVRLALDEGQMTHFVSLIRASAPFETACRALGITLAQGQLWYAHGGLEDADVRLREFRRAVDVAEAEAEARNVAIIGTAARESWQAAAWLLERAHPERWARVSQRKEAQQLTEPEKPGDPFAEVDELAERRRHAG